MPDLSDPLVRAAISELRLSARAVRDRIEELVEESDRVMRLVDGLDDLAAADRPLRIVG